MIPNDSISQNQNSESSKRILLSETTTFIVEEEFISYNIYTPIKIIQTIPNKYAPSRKLTNTIVMTIVIAIMYHFFERGWCSNAQLNWGFIIDLYIIKDKIDDQPRWPSYRSSYKCEFHCFFSFSFPFFVDVSENIKESPYDNHQETEISYEREEIICDRKNNIWDIFESDISGTQVFIWDAI